MKVDDIPLSQNVADRRGKKEPTTLNEYVESNSQEPQPDRSPPPPPDELSRRLGIEDIKSSGA